MSVIEWIITAIGDLVFYAFLAACAVGLCGVAFALAFMLAGTMP